ncbi:MAG: hypothetical protein LCH90_13150 [Proteobacteria bacterium]|nr:hypothetical protein [Pseudomonadota bacterium]
MPELQARKINTLLEALLALSGSRMYESKARRRSRSDQGRSLEGAVL